MFISLTLIFAGYAKISGERPANLAAGKFDIKGTVCDKAEYRNDYGRASFTLECSSLGGEKFNGKIRVYIYASPDANAFPHGRTLLIKGANVTVPDGRTNPQGFDYAAYLWKDGISLCASASLESVETVADENTLFRRLYAVRDSLSGRIDELYANNPDVMKALLLGERSELSDDTYSDFKDAGIAHLIALSGLHVSCMAIMLEFMLCLICVPKRAAAFITTAALILYALMTGMSASIVRAVIMYAALGAAREFGCPSDALTRLSLAFVIQVSINPLVLTDAAFQLSYASVFSLSAITDLFMFRRRRKSALGELAYDIRSALASTTAAQAGTLPIVATLYNAVPVYATFVNMLTIPIGMAALYIGAFSLGASFASMRAGVFIARIADGVWSGIRLLCGFVADLPVSVYNMRSWSFIEGLCFYAALVAVSAFVGLKKRTRRWGLAALAIIAIIVLAIPINATNGLTITFLDVGNGDSAVVNARGNAYVIDCGRANGVCSDYLVSMGADVKGVFVSHADADHSGGLSEVLERYDNAVLYLPECWEDMEVGDGIKKAMRNENTAYLSAGDRVELDYDIYVEVLWPYEGFEPSDDNDGSLVLRVVYGDSSALFMGDLPDPFDMMITADCDVLKVSHHGSKYATTAEFLETATPHFSIISVGANAYGHPSDEVIARLSGSTVLRTDLEGAIMVKMMPNGDLEYTTAGGAKGS